MERRLLDMIGDKINSLDDLINAALNKRAVTCPECRCWEGPIPAAFVQNQIGVVIHRLIKSGLYIYEKPKKRRLMRNLADLKNN